MKMKIQAALNSALIFANWESHNLRRCETSIQRENMVPEDSRTVTACELSNNAESPANLLRGYKPGTATSVEEGDCFLPFSVQSPEWIICDMIHVACCGG